MIYLARDLHVCLWRVNDFIMSKCMKKYYASAIFSSISIEKFVSLLIHLYT